MTTKEIVVLAGEDHDEFSHHRAGRRGLFAILRQSLGAKLMVAFLAVGVIPFAVLGILSLRSASEALTDQAFSQLQALREAKRSQIEGVLEDRQAETGVLVETVNTFRERIIVRLKTIQEQKKAALEEYFARNPGLAQRIDRAVASRDARALAAFGGADATVRKIISDRTGLGKTGEVYVVGGDYLMRFNNHPDHRDHTLESVIAPGEPKIETAAAKAALAGEPGEDMITGHDGTTVLSLFDPLKIEGVNWCVITEMEATEAISPVDAEGKEYLPKFMARIQPASATLISLKTSRGVL